MGGCCLGFADDMIILADGIVEMTRQLAIVEDFCKKFGDCVVALKEKLQMWIEKIGEFHGLKPEQLVLLLYNYAVERLLHILKLKHVSCVNLSELARLMRRNGICCLDP
ncbi:hypothetical protein CDAR_543531 [Caerostris darwini]|uniref:Reverse transcriptase domain-containing protein n=1 Tax=Caerostris darwini TaxID=1538125 RepID=A0AAV4V3L8_9ARAC|nr:hypothetical protein CDAR_543531 [Caerostris darwini]